MRTSYIKSLMVGIAALAMAQPALGQTSGSPKADPIHITKPVVLKQANTVYNMDHLAFAGDLPVGMLYMHLETVRLKANLHIPGNIIGVFHGKAGYMLLNDKMYDKVRHVATGNPYAKYIAMLQKEGVDIEECAVTMHGHHWGNADLLPGVQVNSGAVGRIIQLVQEGYVQIQP